MKHSPGWKSLSTSIELPLFVKIERAAGEQQITKSRWVEGAILLRLLLEGLISPEGLTSRPLGKIRRFMEALGGETTNLKS